MLSFQYRKIWINLIRSNIVCESNIQRIRKNKNCTKMTTAAASATATVKTKGILALSLSLTKLKRMNKIDICVCMRFQFSLENRMLRKCQKCELKGWEQSTVLDVSYNGFFETMNMSPSIFRSSQSNNIGRMTSRATFLMHKTNCRMPHLSTR